MTKKDESIFYHKYDQPFTEYPEDLTGKKVVVVGGGAVGLDVVEYFAPKDADVSIVEMMPVIGKDLIQYLNAEQIQ